jgi:hypothetical protein
MLAVLSVRTATLFPMKTPGYEFSYLYFTLFFDGIEILFSFLAVCGHLLFHLRGHRALELFRIVRDYGKETRRWSIMLQDTAR